MQNVELSFDTSEIDAQLHELCLLLKSRFSEGIPDLVLSDLQSLCVDVVLSNGGTTRSAGGSLEILQRLRFRFSFEDLRAALLTGKRDVHECLQSFMPSASQTSTLER
jgi:hypothetical protein